MADAVPPPPELRRDLTLLDATMVNIGSMIGSGIFLVPVQIAAYVPDTGSILLVWLVGGMVSLLGALSMAELGAMFPKAGGQFVYLREAYGPLWGFLYGWSTFSVIMTGAIAAVAVGFATYVGYFIPLSPFGVKLVAVGSIAALTVVHCFGVKVSALIQNGLTFVKVGALAAIAAIAFVVVGPAGQFEPLFPARPLPALAAPFGLALVAVLWAYDGWIEVTFVGGEVKDPERNLPRALVLSTLVVAGLYVLMNVAFVGVLSPAGVAASEFVASDTATVVFGPAGAALVAMAVIVSMFGANNGFIFTGARIYYAMAIEGVFPRSFGRLHPKYRTPVVSLAGQGAWSSALVFTGTFEQLTTYVVFASWIFYAMSCVGVMVLRHRRPDIPRTYRAWGYPFTPTLFVVFALLLVGNAILASPEESAVGVVLIVAGLPAYAYWRRR